MNKTWILAKTLWKNGNGLGLGSNKKLWGKIPTKVVVPIILILAFLPLWTSFSYLVSSLYDVLAEVGQEGVLIGLGLAVVSFVILIFGIFYIISVFYFSQDIEYLLPIPLKSSQIITAKFCLALIYEYITEIFILLPVIITFGIKSGAGVLYYIYAAAIFLTLPVIPLIIASVIAMVVMRVTNVSRNKDLYRIIGGVVAIALALGINMFFQGSANRNMDAEQLQNLLLNGNNSFLAIVTDLFPSTYFSSQALLQSASATGFAHLMLYLGLSGLIYVIFLLLAEWLYFKGVRGISESNARRKRVSNEKLDKMTTQQSILKSYTIKEMRLLLRTPSYFLNCVLISFLWPVLLIIPLASQSGNLDKVREMAGSIGEISISGIVLAIAAVAILFIGGGNNTASTAISREGQSFITNKFLPVPYGKMLLAKALSGFLLCLVSMILLLVVAIVLVGFPPSIIGMIAVIALPALSFSCLTGVLLDLYFPKLQWDNEQKAVKQNLNSIFNLLLCLIIGGLVALAVYFLQLTVTVTFVCLLTLFIVFNWIFYRVLVTKAVQRFDRIEL